MNWSATKKAAPRVTGLSRKINKAVKRTSKKAARRVDRAVIKEALS